MQTIHISYPFNTPVLTNLINLSTNINSHDLSNFINYRNSKVTYCYQDSDSDQDQEYEIIKKFALSEISGVEILKEHMRNLKLDKTNFVSRLSKLIRKIDIKKIYDEKFIIYLFNKYNKIANYDVVANDNIIQHHPIEIIWSSDFYVLLIINKHLLGRNLRYNDYVQILDSKIKKLSDSDYIRELLPFIMKFLDKYYENIDDDCLRMIGNLLKLKNQVFGSSFCNILIKILLRYSDAIIRLNDAETIISVVKFATYLNHHELFSNYCNFCDINTINIETHFNWKSKNSFYKFFDKIIVENNYVFDIEKIFKLCESNIIRLSLNELFNYMDKYYLLNGNINNAIGLTTSEIAINVLRNIIISNSSNIFIQIYLHQIITICLIIIVNYVPV